MKYLVLLYGLLTVNCARSLAKANKFSLSYLQNNDEKDCVFLDSKENSKNFHFLFMCGDTVVHLALQKQ